jgi:hypothetical protein
MLTHRGRAERLTVANGGEVGLVTSYQGTRLLPYGGIRVTFFGVNALARISASFSSTTRSTGIADRIRDNSDLLFRYAMSDPHPGRIGLDGSGKRRMARTG